MEWFTFGKTSAIQRILSKYPRKDQMLPSLAIDQMLGPTILSRYLASWRDLQTQVATQFERLHRASDLTSLSAKNEARNLAFMIHLDMLMDDTLLQALQKRPSLEVALRRLYALLSVDHSFPQGHLKTRAQAWQKVAHILAQPEDGEYSN